MHPIQIIILILLAATLFILLASFICFMLVFYSGKRKKIPEGEHDYPDGKPYEEFYGQIDAWQDALRQLDCEEIEIRSRDGLILRGKFYKYAEGAPIEIMFHGYRGSATRDLCGGVERCFKLGRSTLIVDQRAHGDSEGHVITFGEREKLDCLDWIDYAYNRFGKEQVLIITGISMGAATVLLASGEPLPENVLCVLADCGYSSTQEIICKVLRDIHLPAPIFYPFIRLGAIIYGGFDPDECNPIDAVQKSKIPIIFVHGDSDGFVPCYMSEQMYEACSSAKSIYIAKGADHGLAFPKDQEAYYAAVRDFEQVWKKINLYGAKSFRCSQKAT